jgi:hypothetical protein
MNFLLDPAIAIYVALAAALVVWLGVFTFLWRIDQHAQELRRKLDQAPNIEQTATPRATIETRHQKSSAATLE